MLLNCHELQDLILLDAADQLSGDQRDDLHEHLSTGCPQCAGYRAEAEAMLAQMSMSLNPHSPPASAKRRLLAMVETKPEEKEKRWPIPIPLFRFAGAGMPSAIAAVLAVAFTSLAFLIFPSLGSRLSFFSSGSDMNQMASRLYYEDHLVNKLQRQASVVSSVLGDFRYAKLTGAGQPNAAALVLIDTQKDVLYFNGRGLNPSAGVYQLWLVSDSKKTSVGTFSVKNDGVAAIGVEIPADLAADGNLAVAITDDPAGKNSSFSGKPILAGPVLYYDGDQSCPETVSSLMTEFK